MRFKEQGRPGLAGVRESRALEWVKSVAGGTLALRKVGVPPINKERGRPALALAGVCK